MITKVFLFLFLFLRFPFGCSYAGQSNANQGSAIDTLFNYGRDKQIIAIKLVDTDSVYKYYRQTGEVVHALLIKQKSLSRQSEELGPYLSRVLDKQLGEGRSEFGLWTFYVILFNNANRIEEVVIIEPHLSHFEDQFQLIRNALQESDDFWEKPPIGDFQYYFTIGRCLVY